MMRFAMVVAAGLIVGACGGQRAGTTAGASGETEQASVPADVQTAVAVARGIEASPDRSDSVLAANGLTPAGFDSLMYRIAADSAMRAAFAAARP
jgi:hypothetical protein